jgi:hypothetical protein
MIVAADDSATLEASALVRKVQIAKTSSALAFISRGLIDRV